MRLLSITLGLAMMATTGTAQTVQYLLLRYSQKNTQTDASTVSPTATPYSFGADVIGDDPMTSTNPISSVSLTLPDGTTTHPLTLDHGDWGYESADYPNTPDQSALLGDFPAGTYQFNWTGFPTTPISVNISNPFSPLVDLNAPMLSVTNGTWGGGVFTVTNLSQDMVISFNSLFNGSPVGTQPYIANARLSGPDYSSNPLGEGPSFFNYNPMSPIPGTVPDTVGDWTIPGGSLTSGESYTVNVSYSYMSSFNDLDSPLTATMYERSTTFTIMAVPEPATYALLAGLVVFAGVVVYRRKRAAA